MSEPKISEVQEHIIEMERVRYRLVDATTLDLPARPAHQSWCWHCAGNAPAPPEDEDRIKIFDHYCCGHHKTLRCDPFRGIIYEKINL